MSLPSLSRDALDVVAQHVGRDWRSANGYYDPAETEMDDRWERMIFPFIAGVDFEVCLDLAAGHGRNTRKLLEEPGCNRVYVVDINEENISFCANRFGSEGRVSLMKNDGFSIPELSDGSLTLFYCFDAMVHFDSDIVRSYLAEAKRLIKPENGAAFLHHSNYTGNPGGDVHDNPAWRNFMSAELMSHYAIKEGLIVQKQLKLDWTHDGSFTDCFSLLRRAS